MKLFKRIIGAILFSTLTVVLGSCTGTLKSSSENTVEKNTAAKDNNTKKTSDSEITTQGKPLEPNKPLFTDMFFADPSAHVFNDKLFIYPSHDTDNDGRSNDNGDQYAMVDYHVLSIDDFNSECVDNGMALHLKDIPWAKKQLWAPDAAYKNNTYYFYFPARDKDDIFRIGVATSSSPTGPFKPEENYIEGSFSIDPAVFMDDDNKAYMFFGGLWGGQLEKWTTGKFDINAKEPKGSDLALGPRVATLSDDMLSFAEAPQEVLIVDENGKPVLAGDEEKRFFEGSWVHKHNGYYYLSYSTGTTHYLAYAMSKNPKGPYTYKGRILNPVKGWTTHHSIVKFKDKWYLFYHDASISGVDHKRSIKFAELTYNSDGTINMIEP